MATLDMRQWNGFVNEVLKTLDVMENLDCPDPFFRGHAAANWQLLPGLARTVTEGSENRFYYDFWSLGAHLMPNGCTTWDRLFLMQHFGLPTRLLDWSLSFSVALYFAVREPGAKSAVWILNPYELNRLSIDRSEVLYLTSDFEGSYLEYFIEKRNDKYQAFPAPAVAVGDPGPAERMRSQKGVFTFHADLETPLERLFPAALRKLVIPTAIKKDARKFLRLAGINEYMVFPDLDGLARYLKLQITPDITPKPVASRHKPRRFSSRNR